MRTTRNRFYGAAALGFCVWLATWGQHEMFRVLMAADLFFVIFVGWIVATAFSATPERLRQRANTGSRGAALLMVFIAAVAVIVSLVAIFTLLNHPRSEGSLFPVLAVLSVPLSWAMLHTNAGVYYARRYYASTKWGVPEGGRAFPEGGDPSGVDFLYYALVIGVSSSVSDVNTTERELRIPTMVHSLSSFIFNTVLIAIAVNAAMTFAG
jgi:uncharacterized membrane protein